MVSHSLILVATVFAAFGEPVAAAAGGSAPAAA
jgi:hypothetical protein